MRNDVLNGSTLENAITMTPLWDTEFLNSSLSGLSGYLLLEMPLTL
jgi:hypothetical protein